MVANHVNEYERQSGLLHLHKELLNTMEGLSDVSAWVWSINNLTTPLLYIYAGTN